MKFKVIVVGTGPVGIRAAEEISSLDPGISISLYGDEPCEPYNRILISNYLAGQGDFSSIRALPVLRSGTDLKTHYGCAIVGIDTVRKIVHCSDRQTERYDKLVLAVGSHAYVPHLENNRLKGIFTLRNVADADALKARESDTAVVLGGGLLGLETARALQSQSNKRRIIVIDHSPSLMNRQLNKEAGDILVEKVLGFGIEVCLSSGIKTINGSDRLESVTLRNDRNIPCDMLVFAVGIRPNVELAKQSGIATRRGIIVNDRLQTSVPDVYAVGECAEFNQTVYGIVAPGFEQAAVMAANVCGQSRRYRGSVVFTQLKVLDYPVFSMGRVGENEPGLPDDRYAYAEPMNDIYRHLVVYRGRLIGCIAMGEWSELSRIRKAIESRRRIWPWQLKRFRQRGLIWADELTDSVVFWSQDDIVCHCNQVSRGTLGQAISAGCQTQAELSAATKAGTTCGSCGSLLAELLGGQRQAVRAFLGLAVICAVTAVAGAAVLLLPPIPYQRIGTIEWVYDALWRDHFLKQVSGYFLLGCSLLVLTLSLRKRLKRWQFGDFAWWRMMHVIIGFVTLLVLVTHTGFRFGDNLNFYLMSSFSGLLVVGAGAGLVIAVEHKMRPGFSRKLRSRLVWMHILLFWPLPALLTMHIMQTYYF